MLTVFNIQRYSLHDGNGVRTNIFFKGCPLRCQWCNNPEGLEYSPTIMYDERLCRRFDNCINSDNSQIFVENGKLVINRDMIPDANVYRNICPSRAMIVAGEGKSISQILQEIEKDIPFYSMSEGGVTLTGGEPLSQGPELKDLIVELKNRIINVTVETSLHLDWEVIIDYVDLIDVFMADLKHVDAQKFKEFTGGDADLVMNNFKNLDSTGKKFIARIPVIPRFNSSSAELFAIIDFVSRLKNAFQVDFIPFHALAKEKYVMVGKEYIFENQNKIEKSELLPFVEYAEQKGLIANIMN